MPAKLRIGVMTASSASVEGWEAYILSQLRQDPDLEWAAVIQHKESQGQTIAFAEKLKKKWRRIPHALAQRAMERFDGIMGRSHYRSVGEFQVDARYPVSQFLPGVPVLEVTPSESPSGLVHRFDAETIEQPLSDGRHEQSTGGHLRLA